MTVSHQSAPAPKREEKKAPRKDAERYSAVQVADLGYDEQRKDLCPDGVSYDAQKSKLEPKKGPGGGGGGKSGGKSGGSGVKPVDTGKVVSRVDKDGAALKAMTLGDLDAYVRAQVDWANSPKLTDADRKAIWPVVKFLLESDTHGAACGKIKVSALLAKGTDKKVLEPLRDYSAAATQSRVTLKIEATTADLDKAIAQGEAISDLELWVGRSIIHRIFTQEQFEKLVDGKLVKAFVDYVTEAGPLLHAHGGAEVKSFRAMHAEATDYKGLKGTLPEVRNFHRFEKSGLTALANDKKASKGAKPVTVVLHSALDHNGAFHRDPKLTEVLASSKNLTFMIEGAKTLADASGHLGPIAKTYGKNDKIDQIMLAGHGSAKSMEMAGDVRDGGDKLEGETEGLTTSSSDKKSQEFFKELVKHMDPSTPNHRIVLNACLTNSIELDETKIKGTTPDERRKSAQAYLNDHKSFADHLQGLGKGLDVQGANASIGRVDLIDPKGKLRIKTSDDPHVTASKTDYLKKGHEPVGVIAAAMELWLKDTTPGQTTTLAAVKHRVKHPVSGSWEEPIVTKILDLYATKYWADPSMMEQLRFGGLILSVGWQKPTCRPNVFERLPSAERVPLLKHYLSKINWTSEPWVPLVGYQVLLKTDAAYEDKFLKQLGGFTAAKARDFVDAAYLGGSLTTLLGKSVSGTAADGLDLLAMMALMTAGSADAGKYLQTRLKAQGNKLTAKQKGLVAGAWTEGQILDKLQGKVKTPSRDNNADTDRDTKNDAYFAKAGDTGIVILADTKVHEKPDETSKELGTFARDSMFTVVGRSGSWLACEHKLKVGYVLDTNVLVL